MYLLSHSLNPNLTKMHMYVCTRSRCRNWSKNYVKSTDLALNYKIKPCLQPFSLFFQTTAGNLLSGHRILTDKYVISTHFLSKWKCQLFSWNIFQFCRKTRVYTQFPYDPQCGTVISWIFPQIKNFPSLKMAILLG